jgi:hypothetical protein
VGGRRDSLNIQEEQIKTVKEMAKTDKQSKDQSPTGRPKKGALEQPSKAEGRR